jgi:hypothetical protein
VAVQRCTLARLLFVGHLQSCAGVLGGLRILWGLRSDDGTWHLPLRSYNSSESAALAGDHDCCTRSAHMTPRLVSSRSLTGVPAVYMACSQAVAV